MKDATSGTLPTYHIQTRQQCGLYVRIECTATVFARITIIISSSNNNTDGSADWPGMEMTKFNNEQHFCCKLAHSKIFVLGDYFGLTGSCKSTYNIKMLFVIEFRHFKSHGIG